MIDSPSFEDVIFGLVRREVELLSDPARTYTPNYQIITVSLMKMYESEGETLPTAKVRDLVISLLKEAMSKEAKDERNRVKQSIVCGMLNNESIDQAIRNEIIEGIIKNESEKGFFAKIFSYFSSSKKIP